MLEKREAVGCLDPDVAACGANAFLGGNIQFHVVEIFRSVIVMVKTSTW